MRRISTIIAALAMSLPFLTRAAEEEKAAKEELNTPSAKLSYSLGMDVGNSLKELETEIYVAVFARGVEDSFKGNATLLTPKEAGEIRLAFFQKRREELAKKREELAAKNLKEGQAFLAENKKKKGVVTTASGLQYIVLHEGDGPKPKATDGVKVHYRGTFLDGTEFDSSIKRGEPATFPVTGVIPGWTEALQLMKVGSKYQLFVPSNLAYGERGSGQRIPPNATLIFEVELLAIQE
jgi:FKBP-type peptidyl-prolyl cis-trans isomerase